MISGALSVYHRALSVGSQTYGKGCAQEYLDDDVRTPASCASRALLYALPDGSPVQPGSGLAPALSSSVGARRRHRHPRLSLNAGNKGAMGGARSDTPARTSDMEGSRTCTAIAP